MNEAQNMMEQAHETARTYAYAGKKAFEDHFDMPVTSNPEAAATYLAGFMQAASTDFAAWAIQKQLELLREALDGIVEEAVDRLVALKNNQGG